MNVTSVENLESLIVNGNLIERACASVSDWDSALDARDGGDFDSLWSAEFKRLHAKKVADADADECKITKLREFVFKKVFDFSSSSDAASCISDDFGMIAECIVLNDMSVFAADLLGNYLAGRFPGVRQQ